jgi:hypothetical protein
MAGNSGYWIKVAGTGAALSEIRAILLFPAPDIPVILHRVYVLLTTNVQTAVFTTADGAGRIRQTGSYAHRPHAGQVFIHGRG